MSLRIPPVVVFFVFALAMYLFSLVLPVGVFEFFGRLLLVKVLVGFALLIGVASVLQFFAKKTTVDPRTPSKANVLVTNGIYKFTRNPMYLALLVMLLAVGAFLGNAFNSIIAAGFVSYMNRFQIVPEEQMLAQKFGTAYQRYLSKTRRWF